MSTLNRIKIIHTDDHKLMRMGVKNAFFTGGAPERDAPHNKNHSYR
jgi:hypothetical protein